MRTITFSQATLEALDEEMARDPRIFVVGEGIGPRGGNSTPPWASSTNTASSACGYPHLRARLYHPVHRGCRNRRPPVVDFMFSDFMLDALGD